jgi:hypothetical protein
MPRFHGVGPRLRERMIAMGYTQPNGEPDVRNFSFDFRYGYQNVYDWLHDRKTPTKEVERLCGDLAVEVAWLLLGVGKPGPVRTRRPKLQPSSGHARPPIPIRGGSGNEPDDSEGAADNGSYVREGGTSSKLVIFRDIMLRLGRNLPRITLAA